MRSEMQMAADLPMTAGDIERMEQALVEASNAEVAAAVVAEGKLRLQEAKRSVGTMGARCGPQGPPPREVGACMG